jgi:hypothetical protein
MLPMPFSTATHIRVLYARSIIHKRISSIYLCDSSHCRIRGSVQSCRERLPVLWHVRGCENQQQPLDQVARIEKSRVAFRDVGTSQ